MNFSAKSLAGVLLVLGSAWLLFGILICETLYPGYRVTQMISDLGVGSTAYIYNASIFGLGICFLGASILLRSAATSRAFLVLLALTGLGAAGVGIFPETIVIPHTICAMTTFIAGGLCALYGIRLFDPPWSWFSAALGIVMFAAILLLAAKIYPGIAAGGMERMIAYPLIVWGIGSGAQLMSREKTG